MPVPPNQTTMDSDAGIFLRREVPNAAGGDGEDRGYHDALLPDPVLPQHIAVCGPLSLHSTSLPNP